MKKLDNFGIDHNLTKVPDDIAEYIAGLTTEQIEAIRQEFDFGGFADLPAEDARWMARLMSYLPHTGSHEAA